MSTTYGNLALEKSGKRWLMTSLAPHVAIRLKHIFPRISKGQTDNFQFPNDQMHCADLSWFMQRYPLAIAPADTEVLLGGHQLFLTERAELERILTPDYKAPAMLGLKPGMFLRTYQAQAGDILLRRQALLLGDDLGLGKTYEALGFCLNSGVLPAAIVVQTHLQRQWLEKAFEFTNLRVHLINKTKPYELPPADVYIFKYSQPLGWIDLFKQQFFVTVIYDEIQELRRGTDSLKGVACLELSNNAKYRLGLSATPIYNLGGEAWHIMQYIDPTVLGEHGDFMREWIGAGGQVANPEALGTFLREQHVFLRRTKRDVGQFVPPVNKIIETVETDERALKDIAVLANQLAMRVSTGSFMERGQAARELDLLARHATGVAKARGVAAYVRILLENKIPVILAGWHRDVYEIWLKELADFNPAMYTGSESQNQKDSAKKAFIDGHTDLLIISLRSGAGLDGLQYRCSTVVLGELDWSPKVMEQLVGRADREGQPDPVTAIYLVSEDGSDPPMIELLGLKSSQAAGIVDPGLTFEATTADYSRIKALARQFLDKKQIKALDASVPPEAEPIADKPEPGPAGTGVQLELV